MFGENLKHKLFCKPPDGEFLFHSNKYRITWVSLNLDKHLHVLYDWVNMAYSQDFWQMSGSLGMLRSCYQCTLQNPFTHPFIAYYEQRMIAFFDVYSLHADELGKHVEHTVHDAGVHLLMSPNKKRVQGMSANVVLSFLDYYFSFDCAKYIYAEPDEDNKRSIRVLSRCGFEYIETLDMSYKRAELHCLTRVEWQKNREVL